jgi:hypothetical protein
MQVLAIEQSSGAIINPQGSNDTGSSSFSTSTVFVKYWPIIAGCVVLLIGCCCFSKLVRAWHPLKKNCVLDVADVPNSGTESTGQPLSPTSRTASSEVESPVSGMTWNPSELAFLAQATILHRLADEMEPKDFENEAQSDIECGVEEESSDLVEESISSTCEASSPISS